MKVRMESSIRSVRHALQSFSAVRLRQQRDQLLTLWRI
jgi:hypothetical protein